MLACKLTRSFVLSQLLMFLLLIVSSAAWADAASQLVEASKVAYREGAFQKSIDLAQQALKEQPTYEDALHMLSVTLIKEGRFDEAEGYAIKLVDSYPNNELYKETLYLAREKPRLDRIRRCASAGAYDCALREAQKMIADYPQMPDGYAMFGTVLILRGEIGDQRLAGSTLHQAITAQGNLPIDSFYRLDSSIMASVYAGLGITYFNLGDYSEAEIYFREALELDPEIPDGQMSLEMASEMRRNSESTESTPVRWLSLMDVKNAIEKFFTRP